MYLLRMPSNFGTLKTLKLKGGSKDAMVVATNQFLKNLPHKWESSFPRGEKNKCLKLAPSHCVSDILNQLSHEKTLLLSIILVV